MSKLLDFLLSMYTYDPLATSMMALIAIYLFNKKICTIDKLWPLLSKNLKITGKVFQQNILFFFLGAPIVRSLLWLIESIFNITGGVLKILHLLLTSLGSTYSLYPIHTIVISLICIAISVFVYLKSGKVRWFFIMLFIFLVLNALAEPIVKQQNNLNSTKLSMPIEK